MLTLGGTSTARSLTSRPGRALAGLGLSMILMTGCSLESLAESAVETAVEKAVEADTGENFDLDFGSGGFSIETDDGEMRFDAETGEFVLVDQNGETTRGTFDLDADGLAIESTEGNVRFDTDTGTFVVEDEDGNVTASGTIDANGEGINIESTEGDLTYDAETGEFVAEGNDGESVTGTVGQDGQVDLNIEDSDGNESTMQFGPEFADQWPDDVLAVYPDAVIESAAVIDGESSPTRMITFVSDDSVDQVTDFYTSATDGWEGTRSSDGSGTFMVLTDDDWNVQIVVTSQGSQTNVALTAVGT